MMEPGVGEDAVSDWSVEKMLELGRLHARLEAERRLEPLMGTLVPHPVYEFHPMRLTLRGHTKVRRYYEQLLGHFMDRVRGYELLDEWANDHSVAQEYDIRLEVDGSEVDGSEVDGGGIEAHRVLGVLFREPGTELLGGERVYGGERIVRLMVGDLYDELEALR